MSMINILDLHKNVVGTIETSGNGQAIISAAGYAESLVDYYRKTGLTDSSIIRKFTSGWASNYLHAEVAA